jgi:predicted cobalt transporter CbtA
VASAAALFFVFGRDPLCGLRWSEYAVDGMEGALVSGGDIAGLIAAGVFAVLVGFIAIPLVKLGRVLDQTREAIRDASDGITPILEETATTIQETNKQLARVDVITRNVADVTGNVSALVALFAATVGGPLIKLAGFSAAVRAAFRATGGSRRSRGTKH